MQARVSEIKGRIDQIRREIENTSSNDYDREKLEERLASWPVCCQVNVGAAATESEMKEKKARVEDALHATPLRSKKVFFQVVGGFVRASSQVKPDASLSHDETVGFISSSRLPRSMTMIASNAGQDGGIVCERVVSAKNNEGYNALTDTYEDLVEGWRHRPTKVTRTALANAASVSTLLLTSDALIAEKPKADKGGKGGHADHDMY